MTPLRIEDFALGAALVLLPYGLAGLAMGAYRAWRRRRCNRRYQSE